MKKIIGIFGAILFTSLILTSCDSKPNACDCIDILNVPTKKVGIGMPLPIEDLSNEDYGKYKKCYEAYAGPATATLKCGGK